MPVRVHRETFLALVAALAAGGAAGCDSPLARLLGQKNAEPATADPAGAQGVTGAKPTTVKKYAVTAKDAGVGPTKEGLPPPPTKEGFPLPPPTSEGKPPPPKPK